MKKGFVKAVHLFTGNKTLVPVSSTHYVTCPDCSNVDNFTQFSPCSYCEGCLDCRFAYMSPTTKVLTFSQLLDLFENALIPF